MYQVDTEILIKAVCDKFNGGDEGLGDRIFSYAMKGWVKFPSAMLSAAMDDTALPISCFLTQVDESIEDIINHVAEVSLLTIHGGGVSGDWSAVEQPNERSPGPVGLMNTVNSAIKTFRQNQFRRGGYAAYLDISHPSILEFLSMRTPGGDGIRKNLDLHHAVNIPDSFMLAVLDDRSWSLVSPQTGHVVETMRARHLWEMLLEMRHRSGEPFIIFTDTVNRFMPFCLKLGGYQRLKSNLCTEIYLPTGPQMTAVCCLSSLNVAEYSQWKDSDLVGDIIEMLDNSIQYFIDHAPPETFRKAIVGARKLRPLGLGVLGLAQYYQRQNIPFESLEARAFNINLFSELKQKAIARSQRLAEIRGEPEGLVDSGMRNSHLLAVAPTANTFTLLNTPPSIEPWPANAFTHRTKTGSVLIKNPELEKLLADRNQNTSRVWNSIIVNNGSVAHLDFLSSHEKQVFKTAYEINPKSILTQAADRQHYICHGQSLTLFLPKNLSKKEMHHLHFLAWKNNCKGLYYVRTQTIHRVEVISECESCQV